VLTVILAVTFFAGFASSSSYADASSKNCTTIEFCYNGKSYKYVDKEIIASDHLVEIEMFNRKINAPLRDKLLLVERMLHAGTDYKKAMDYTFIGLDEIIDKIVKDVNSKPKNSVVKFYPNQKPMFKISREKCGYEIDSESLYRDVYTHLRRKQSSNDKLIIRPKVITPTATASENVKGTQLRAKFTTSFANSSNDRKSNIQLAFSKINGTVLYPNEEFSFNKIVGSRTIANGFKEAKIIVNGEYVPGIGGGVCQASTTLYNAAIRADMEILEVHNHSLLSSYVPPSFDAMVNSGSADLRFRNTSDMPIYIRALGANEKAIVEFFGLELPFSVKTDSVIISKTSPPLDKQEIDAEYKYFDKELAVSGEIKRIANPQAAVKSEGYLEYKDKQGNLLERKKIRTDSYKGIAGKIVIAP